MTWRIYLVEDHEVVRQSYIMFLETLGDFEVCGEAGTAEEAIEDLEGADPDLLLVDVSLPGMNGIELIKRLRDAGALVPAIVLTGHDNDMYRDGALKAGARDFVTKQEGADALLEAVYRVLDEANEGTE